MWILKKVTGNCQRPRLTHVLIVAFIVIMLICVDLSLTGTLARVDEMVAGGLFSFHGNSKQFEDQFDGLDNCTDGYVQERLTLAAKLSNPNGLSTYLDMPPKHIDPDLEKPKCRPKQIYKILFYNYDPYWDANIVRSYLKQCVYDNCQLSTDRSDFRNASAVIFHYYYMGFTVPTPPVSPVHRNSDQAWVLYGREPPIERNVQALRNSAWQNTFNWTMTYRLDSDMISAYGGLRTRARAPVKDYDAIFDSKTKMAAWIVSSCRTQGGREQFVKDLKSHGIQVDVYGRCGSRPNLPVYNGKSTGNVPGVTVNGILTKYKFYLSLENSNCHDYITEKFFARYDNDLILVARGGADYDKVLPTKTYINAAHFNNTKILAEYMLKLGNDRNAYIEMLRRKDQYEADGPWPFGWRYGFCGLCEKVNNMDQHRKTYSDVHAYLTKDVCVISPNITTYKET